jgi:hypothetical protein
VSALDTKIGNAATELEEVERRLAEDTPKALERKRQGLRLALGTLEAERQDEQRRAAETLTESTRILEEAYEHALTALSSYVEAAERVSSLRGGYDAAFRRARSLGVELPDRVEPLAVRITRDRELGRLGERLNALSLRW